MRDPLSASIYISALLFVLPFSHSFADSRLFSPLSPLRATFPALNAVGPSCVEVPVENYEDKSKLHKTLVGLSGQISTLFVSPLDSNSSLYGADTRLVVLDREQNETIELVSSRDELASLTNALVLAYQASSRATDFIFSLGLQGDEGKSTPRGQPNYKMEYRIAVDDKSDKLLVDWSTSITSLAPTPGSGSSISVLSGRSLLTLKNDTISEHSLQTVLLNDQEQDAVAIGQFLSFLRKTVRGFQGTSLGQSLGANSAFLGLIRDGWMQQIDDPSKRTFDEILPAVYEFKPDMIQKGNASDWAIIKCNITSPCPGTASWDLFEEVYTLSKHFISSTIPKLSQATQGESIRSYFHPSIQFFTLDNSTLLSGSSDVANFFCSLAVLRSQSFGTWRLKSAQLLDWNHTSASVRVQYETPTSLPGASKASTIRGSDVYSLQLKTGLGKGDQSVLIKSIQQEEFVIGGNENKQDGLWAMKAIGGALEGGRIRIADEKLWEGLVDRLGLSRRSVVETRPLSMLKRSDSVALTTYRIMEALHADMHSIVQNNTGVRDNPVRPPAIDYAVEGLELVGYLGEVLLHGKNLYTANVGLPIISLRAAIDAGRITMVEEPKTRVELKSNGDIGATVILDLRLLPLKGLPGAALFADLSRLTSESSIPMKLEIISNYILDEDTGMIRQHQLVESRVNGQLTPGDVVSRWIKRDKGGPEGLGDESSRLRILTDAAIWLDSLSKRQS